MKIRSSTNSPSSAHLLRHLSALAAVALAAVAISGCGGSDSTSSEAASTARTSSTEAQATTPKQPGKGSANSKPAGSKSSSGSGGSGGAPKPKPSIAEEESEIKDQSIQNYGATAEGTEKEAVLDAMHSFLVALGNRNYQDVCATLSAESRMQLAHLTQLEQEGSQSCTAVVRTVVLPAINAEAKAAAAGKISKVRVGEGNAFIVFRPRGGKLSYFVLKEEDGTWKATNLAPGTPFP